MNQQVNRVSFARARDCDDLNYQAKEWAPEEMRFIRELLIQIREITPGILLLASSGNKLVFVRVSGIKAHENHGRNFPIARTSIDHIYISDAFLSGNDRLLHLLHELIHAADAGGRLAYSREFALFAGDVRHTRQRLVQLNVNIEEVDRFCREERICPRFSSIMNLKEALAYDVCAFLAGQGYPIPVSIAKKLFRPSAEDTLWREHFVRGAKLLSQKKYGEAILEFRVAEQIDRSSPMCHLNMAVCYSHIDLLENSAEQLQSAIRYFEGIGIKKEPNRIYAEFCYAKILVRLHKYNEAKARLKAISADLSAEEKTAATEIIQYCDHLLRTGQPSRSPNTGI